VVVTGRAPKIARAAAREKALQGKAPEAGVLQAAAARAAEGIELRADSMGSAAYKAQLAAVIAGRALQRAVARARGAR
jgi:carbon-monoxide dehydrogenase medium subunit